MQQQNEPNSKFLGKFSYLLASLLTLLIGVAVGDNGRASATILCLLFAAVLLAAIATACRLHKTIRVGLALAIPMLLVSIVAVYASDSPQVVLVHDVLAIAFFLFSSYHVLCAVLGDKQVTLDTIVGAICLYLLMGLVWTYLYSIIQTVDPSAFGLAPTVKISSVSLPQTSGLQPLVYLSFVTMTTLGYGDIAPVSRLAQTACYLQAVFGQFFLAVLVARLVALYLASTTKLQEEHS